MSRQLDSLESWRARENTQGFRLSLPGVAVAVASGKGGVGKTHLSLALGMALRDLGHRVLLVDGDLGLANLHLLAGVTPEFNLEDVMRGRSTLAQAVVPLEDGLDLLPSASGVAGLTSLEPDRFRPLGEALAALERAYAFVLVDTGAGIGETTLSLVLASDRTLLVTTTEATANADAYALLKVARSRRADLPFALVVNQCEDLAEGRATGARLAQVVRRFLSAELPVWDPIPRQTGLDRLLRERRPVFRADPDGPFSTATRQIALRLVAGVQRTRDSGFFGRIGSR